jgi:hypothetical protein
MDGVLRFLTGATFEGGNRVTFRPRRPEDLALERLGPIAVGATRLELRYPAPGDPRGDDAPVVVAHLAGPPCTVNGSVLAPGATRGVPLARPRQVAIPAARTYDSRLALRAGTRLIVTVRAPSPSEPGDVVLDAGLPFMPRDLADVLFDAEGRRRYETVVLDPSALRADRETMKPARFWTDAALTAAIERFERDGGRVERQDPLIR